MQKRSEKEVLKELPSGQLEDSQGRKLIAKGYCHDIGENDFNLIMRTWDGQEYGEEEIWTVDESRTPDGMQVGSFMRLFDDSSLEVFAPVWTAEEIAEIKERAAELSDFFGIDESK